MLQKSIHILIVITIAFTVSIANAQTTLRRELLAPPVVLLPFLQVDELQKEIKLSPEQKAKTQTFISESNNIQKLPSKGRQMQGDILEGNVKKVLSSAQIERLNQFYLQLRGASVLSNPRVQKLLDLSGEQTNNLTRINNEESSKMMEINNAGYDPQERQKRKETALNQWHAKMMDVLTPDQKKQLQTLKGEKFGFDISKIDI